MKYHNITYDDMKNGDGLRCVLWVSGCEHHCEDCQNPLTWDPNDGLLFDTSAKEELFSYLKRDYISGLTLSGGDPLFPTNIDEITALCKEVKEKFPEKNIWMYTGYRWEDISDFKVIEYIDVCVDGKYMKNLCDVKLKWRGSSNQRVINVNRTLMENKLILFCE